MASVSRVYFELESKLSGALRMEGLVAPRSIWLAWTSPRVYGVGNREVVKGFKQAQGAGSTAVKAL